MSTSSQVVPTATTVLASASAAVSTRPAVPGDTKGQGVGGIWWVLSPAGERITG